MRGKPPLPCENPGLPKPLPGTSPCRPQSPQPHLPSSVRPIIFNHYLCGPWSVTCPASTIPKQVAFLRYTAFWVSIARPPHSHLSESVFLSIVIYHLCGSCLSGCTSSLNFLAALRWTSTLTSFKKKKKYADSHLRCLGLKWVQKTCLIPVDVATSALCILLPTISSPLLFYPLPHYPPFFFLKIITLIQAI